MEPSYKIAPLEILLDNVSSNCQCYSCQHLMVSTFHLAYFVKFGLKFEEFRQEGGVYFFRITRKVVAKAFEIMEQRADKLQKVSSLETMCYHSLGKNFPELENEAYVPHTFRKNMYGLEGAFNAIDLELSKTPGNTIFRPFQFPKFLFRHVGCYIAGLPKEDLLL